MSRFVLDCALSRPVDTDAAQWLGMAATRAWAPPSAGYHEAKISEALLQQAGRTLAGLLSGANAWFVAEPAQAVAHATLDVAVGGEYREIVTGQADPLVVQESVEAAAAQAGLGMRILPVDSRGRLTEMPDGPCVLVTSAVNQEIGTRQAPLSDWARRSGSAVVLEASSAYGWTDLPDHWDRVVLDARAWGSPAGAVAVVSRVPGRPRMFDNVPAAVAAGLTAQRWAQAAVGQRQRTRDQLRRIVKEVRSRVSDVDVHGAGADDAPHIVSLSVLYVDAEALQSRLDAKGYAVGSGSACASRTGQPSHVLAAIGGLTSGNVRLGLPPDLPEEAVNGFIEAFVEVVAAVRAEMGTDRL
jgi:cysteine desulfurase